MFQITATHHFRKHVSALFLIYAVGILGVIFEPFDFSFASLTPLNIIFTFILLIVWQTQWRWIDAIWMLMIYILGFTVEWVGVHYTFLFGSYHYGEHLGVKVDDVPLLIGINWLLLIYATQFTFRPLIKNGLLRSFVAAAVMVALDLLIEPVAPQLDLWHWQFESAPLRNYLTWFLVAFVLQFGLARFISGENRMAPYVLGAQFIFFAFCLSFNFFF